MSRTSSRPNLSMVSNLRELQAEGAQVEVELVELDPTRRGYHVAWNYGTRYWLPLLGPVPWAVWQTLLSFCFGERDTCWPSISLIADIAAGGNRKAIAGRWRGKGDKRRRQPGALEILQQTGLLSVETQHTGSRTRYRFHVLKEPPLLAPDQLAQLPPRLQKAHAQLLARCGLDAETYPQSIHRASRGGVQGTMLAAPGPTPGVQGPTNKYKEETQIERVWTIIKEALKLEMTQANYAVFVADTQAISFDRDTGVLLVETPTPLVAAKLNNHLQMTIMRTVASTDVSVRGVRIVAVEFVPRPPPGVGL
jgi:hypothetical protein